MPIKAYYNASISSFIEDDTERILGILTGEHHHTLEQQHSWAWLQQISILKDSIGSHPDGRILLEFYIPRMGKRADAVLIANNVVVVIEFKAGAHEHTAAGFEQVEDYALDLKNFHEGSHTAPIVPVLVSTKAESEPIPELKFADDRVATPVGTNQTDLGALIDATCAAQVFPILDIDDWIDLGSAKAWLRDRARGAQRFGLVASSGAQRLRPEGIHIRARIDPATWFLNDSTDVRSSYYLEDVASEFDVQGLELDWAGVCWDGDFHY